MDIPGREKSLVAPNSVATHIVENATKIRDIEELKAQQKMLLKQNCLTFSRS